MVSDRIILGIDPGTGFMGYGAIHINNGHTGLISCDAFNFSKLTSQAMKLKKIFENTIDIIEKYKPDEMAIETPFYGKNIQSMFKLGRAQGVSIAAALYRNIPIFEYSPKKIKLAVTGNGNASKEQVAAMVVRHFRIKTEIKRLDASDALAVAMCHYFQTLPGSKQLITGKRYRNWKDYVERNLSKLEI